MSRDFDSERRARHAVREEELGDRTIIVGGEEFTYRAFASYTVLGEISGEREDTADNMIADLEQSLLKMLEPGQEERFLAAIRSQDDPWTFADLIDLVQGVTELLAGRPTQASSPSDGGDAQTSTSSTEDSSSEPAVASAA